MMTQDTKVDWGVPIPVNGKRPEWLADADQFMWQADEGWEWRRSSGARCSNWTGNQGRVFIRLPADHPYYTQPTPTNEVRERMEALEAFVREVAETQPFADDQDRLVAKARALLDPVDGDLIEARKLVGAQGYPADYADVEDDSVVGIALAAIKRGRALAEAGK
ncbi:hypothetical protein [Sphingomonas beigongshangi]|uniref:hypothetical protein n=1 Tax=Sphingomonas beigongshangi TaxID=2782540 RepID=UPI00193B30F8|nr:hypothetical protein [Sphingomonas beigongshangi]